jgi:hypothetical protein
MPGADPKGRLRPGRIPVVRALVLLLVAPALLMPPGMCICQFVPCGGIAEPASALPSSGSLRADARFTETTACTCGSRHARSSAEKTPSGAACSSHDCGSGSSDNKNPCPLPGKQWPGCPAAVGSAVTKLSPPASALFLAFDFSSVYVGLVTESVTPVSRVCLTSVLPAATPLFVSHCALLI